MNEKQIQISVNSGAVTISVNTTTAKTDIQQALSLAYNILKENLEPINDINQQIPSKAKSISSESSTSDEASKLVASNIDRLKTPQIAIVVIMVYGNQTKLQLKDRIESWGKHVGGNLDGGNFSRDLLKTGLLREVGKNDDGKILYGLTERGKIDADKVLTELRSGTK